MWYICAVSMFMLWLAAPLDIVLYVINEDYTLTANLQEYFGGSKESMRAAMWGALAGGMLVHVTAWGKPSND